MENSVKGDILQKAGCLFMRYGIKSITMDDIAREVGASKKTLYQHFKDKNDLVLHFVQGFLKMEEDVMNAFKEKFEDAMEELKEHLKFVREKIANVNPAMVFDLRKYHPDAYKLFEQFKKECIITSIVDTIEKGKKQGYFRTNFNSLMIATMRIEQVNWMLETDHEKEFKMPAAEVHMQVLLHFITGLCTEKGIKQLGEFN